MSPADVGALRNALQSRGIEGAEIQTFGSDREIVVRARAAREGADANDTQATGEAVGQAFDAVLGAGKYKVLRTEAVGPKVGGELREQAVFAILLSFVAVLAYLAYRFEWRFGVAAVVATGHDIIAAIAFIGLARLEVSLFVVAGLLTIVGYSLNDTIVIFDRIRENLHRRKRESFENILNRSINETLPRTFFTGTTALGSLVALSVLGGDVVRPFALLMLFGVVVGTFSSIYIASPVLLAIEKRWPGPDARGHLGREGRGAPGRWERPEAAAGRVRDNVTLSEAKGAMCEHGPLRFAQGDTVRSPSMLIDTHCHLADPAYDPDRPAGARTRLGLRLGPRRRDRRVSRRRRPGARSRRRLTPASPPPPASIPTTRAAGAPTSRSGSASGSAIPASSPPARWGSTTTTTTRPATRQRAAFEAQLALAGEAGWPAVIHAGRPTTMSPPSSAISPASPPSSTRSAAAPGSCERGWSSATMCRSAGWSPSRAGVWTRPSGRRRSTGCSWRPTAPISPPCPIAGSATSPRSSARWRSGSPPCGASTPDELIAHTSDNAARAFGLHLPPAESLVP